MATKRKISQDLKDTLESNSKITEVHFTKTGHSFTAHELDGKKFARLEEYTIPGKDGEFGKKALRGVKDQEISETLSREEVLGLPVTVAEATKED